MTVQPTFQAQLNAYIDAVGCTSRDLARMSGISDGTIRRYRRGEREPIPGSSTHKRLAAALADLAAETGRPFDRAAAVEALDRSLRHGISVEYGGYVANLNALVRALGIGNQVLARELHFDPSYISRILAGRRHPGNLQAFNRQLALYVAAAFRDAASLAVLSRLTGTDLPPETDQNALAAAVGRWLGTHAPDREKNPLASFLERLDAFELHEYIQSLSFDALKQPGQRPLHTPRVATGLRDMMETELDFIRITAMSDKTDDLIVYSDMPMEEMSKDPDFPKAWMYGTALLLKKGLRLHMVHDVNRPLEEMMLGLESYIPLYMTGQIAPYYLKRSQGGVFLHLLKVSGAAALSGEAITGHHEAGAYYLTKRPEEVAYYRARAEALLRQAAPLMEIFRANRRDDFTARLEDLLQAGREIKWTLGGLPLFTMPDAMLIRLPIRHPDLGMSAEEILHAAHRLRREVAKAGKRARVRLEVPLAPEADYKARPVCIAAAPLFSETDALLSFDDYAAHLEATKAFAAENGISLAFDPAPAFRNISILVCKGKGVVVSKAKNPAVHFLIAHPNLVRAFEAFAPSPQVDRGETFGGL